MDPHSMGFVVPSADKFGNREGKHGKAGKIDNVIAGKETLLSGIDLSRISPAALREAANAGDIAQVLRSLADNQDLEKKKDDSGEGVGGLDDLTAQTATGSEQSHVPEQALSGINTVAEQNDQAISEIIRNEMQPEQSPRDDSTYKAVPGADIEKPAAVTTINDVIRDLDRQPPADQLRLFRAMAKKFDPPQPPEIMVGFEIPGSGGVDAYYHDVIVTPVLVVLVYDNRFKHGIRYRPPVMENQSVTLTVHEEDKPIQRYEVGLFGQAFDRGNDSYTVLVRSQDVDHDDFAAGR